MKNMIKKIKVIIYVFDINYIKLIAFGYELF